MIAEQMLAAQNLLAQYAIPSAGAPLNWPLNTAVLLTPLRTGAAQAGLREPASALALLEALNRLCKDLASDAHKFTNSTDAARYNAAKAALLLGIQHTRLLVT